MSAAAPHSAKTRPRLLMVDPPGSPDQLNQAYKLGAPMPSREVAKWTGQSPLVFRMRQTVRLFLSCRETAIIASPQQRRDSMRETVLTLVTFGALGRLVRSLLPGRRPFRCRALITPRLKKLPVADLARVTHGGGPGSAVLMGADARLAAAAIGTAPGGISRLFGNLVSPCKAEGLPIATASASAGAGFRLKVLWAIR